MTPDKPRYEVWRETVQGVWTLAHEEDGTQHFQDAARAEKLLESLVDEGMVRQAVMVRITPMKAVNCAGKVFASKMGLKNVQADASFKIITAPRRTIK